MATLYLSAFIGRLLIIGAVVHSLFLVLLALRLPLPDWSNGLGSGGIQSLLRESPMAVHPHRTKKRPIATTQGGASACLLINDENPRLPEWIAYHYRTLPLRSLTVAVDPASRTSPAEILSRWNDTFIEVQLWKDEHYLHEIAGSRVEKNKFGHQKRQNHFFAKCMADFKRRDKQWVLLIDVDEYIAFNRITEHARYSPFDNDGPKNCHGGQEDEEPTYPLEQAPEGVTTLLNWKWNPNNSISGWIANHTLKQPLKFQTDSLISQLTEVQPGGIVIDKSGMRYFLRDDLAARDRNALHEPPEPMPTLKRFFDTSLGKVCGEIYNDIYANRENGTIVYIDVDWEQDESGLNGVHGGYVVEDKERQKYFLEKEQALWPKRLSLKEARDARERLSTVHERMTVLDVLNQEAKRYENENTIGPCITMPRLRYGSFERNQSCGDAAGLAPNGFSSHDFVTLRYRWHEIKGTYALGKTLIDVSRVAVEELNHIHMSMNVHAPLQHYCARQVWYNSPQYTTSLFRVNHYLDSLEAFTYRNDIRLELQKRVEKYNNLASLANYSMDAETSLWLHEFVEDVGSANAKKLLAGAGSFPNLQLLTISPEK